MNSTSLAVLSFFKNKSQEPTGSDYPVFQCYSRQSYFYGLLCYIAEKLFDCINLFLLFFLFLFGYPLKGYCVAVFSIM